VRETDDPCDHHTKMLRDQLKAAALLSGDADFPGLRRAGQERIAAGRRRRPRRRRHGKAVGLPPIGSLSLVYRCLDVFLVEATAADGRSLKAFAPHEPQVPRAATTVVQVVGIDVLGTRWSRPTCTGPVSLAPHSAFLSVRP